MKVPQTEDSKFVCRVQVCGYLRFANATVASMYPAEADEDPRVDFELSASGPHLDDPIRRVGGAPQLVQRVRAAAMRRATCRDRKRGLRNPE